MNKEKFDSLSDRNMKHNYFLMIFINKLTCTKCYRFHVYHINNIVNGIKVIGISNENHKLLKFDFPHVEICNYIPFKLGKGFDFVIMFVTKTGKIIYIDIADIKDHLQGEHFYKKINNFLISSKSNQ